MRAFQKEHIPTENAAASERIIASIYRKRSGKSFDLGQVEDLVGDFVAGRIPDYQMAAWLATIACKGMTIDETAALTNAYINGGKRLHLASLTGPVVDKHSTGGVGDKVSLIVVPVVAACGVRVAKMSGRGLGHAGGTVDKLESISGLRMELSADEVISTLRETGMVITGQSADLAPGDQATYELRDLTGTVESVPLIAASILSKKIALGTDGLVLDVKTGSGSLIPDREVATLLAETMVEIASRFGLSCKAAITNMDQPLGYAVGNALEVKEALAVLRGERIPDLSDLCSDLAVMMLQTVDSELSHSEARKKVLDVIDSGKGYEQFVRWARAQGADIRGLARPDLLPTASNREIVTAKCSGWIEVVDPRAIGMAALHVGAGRLVRGEKLDHGAGVVLYRRVGDRVTSGDPVAEIHYSDRDPSASRDLVSSAFAISAYKRDTVPVMEEIIHSNEGLRRCATPAGKIEG